MTNQSTIFFEQVLSQSLSKSLKVNNYQTLSGGSINQAVALHTVEGSFFLKYNAQTPADMFAKEAQGLELLRKTEAIALPKVLGIGQDFLLLELIDARQRIPDFWADFGRSLAALHRHSAPQFGLNHDNYIGKLPQPNTLTKNGVEFFIEHRLRQQTKLAYDTRQIDQALCSQLDRLYDKLPKLLPHEAPALLHGDLWSGNVMNNAEGVVTLIDPAVYYGLREAELAFTEMFGRFDSSFYEAYHQTFPLEPGYSQRVDLYNLYPTLVHVNLFGQGYVGAVKLVVRRFVG
ncbi:fructosamine kinase family protein [Microscilla marina]|uniref:Ketosamine-3-kinase n=1 Tax=Microscilla marina ATCC 23134 TaxID=313606 RepID=A1ZV74_MICM2|nr:fructosamine kinase family protein [Microscilla marina]EAY25730.1 ketosamine-3-kinase [Microscilla marina ATCC 23134]